MESCKIKHAVYRYVLEEKELYIGKTDRGLIRRLRQHGVSGDNITQDAWDEINRADIYYVETINSTMTDVLESEMIRRHKPKYNKAKTSEWTGLILEEPKWRKLDKKLLGNHSPQKMYGSKPAKEIDRSQLYKDLERNISACEKATEILKMAIATRPPADEDGRVAVNIGMYDGNVLRETTVEWCFDPYFYASLALICDCITDKETGEVFAVFDPWRLLNDIKKARETIEMFREKNMEDIA